jgi:hypothetical membrane protein
MKKDSWLLSGPLAGIVLASGIAILPLFVPGYSPIRQTVSEIGEVGSPAQIPFSIMLIVVGTLVFIFSIGVHRISVTRGNGTLVAYFIGILTILLIGIALCPFPHPLHNFFGTSELIVYQAPMVLALQWRKDPKAAQLVSFSWMCFIGLWISLALNFIIFFRDTQLWLTVKPVYGLIQRLLFAGLCVWLIGTGVLLHRINRHSRNGDSSLVPKRMQLSKPPT